MAKLDALSRAGTALARASRWFWPSSMAAAMLVSAGRMAVSTVAPKLPAVQTRLRRKAGAWSMKACLKSVVIDFGLHSRDEGGAAPHLGTV